MKLTADLLLALIAIEHIWILVLEMFLWTHPIGLKTFRQSRATAEASKVLAANPGLVQRLSGGRSDLGPAGR